MFSGVIEISATILVPTASASAHFPYPNDANESDRGVAPLDACPLPALLSRSRDPRSPPPPCPAPHWQCCSRSLVLSSRLRLFQGMSPGIGTTRELSFRGRWEWTLPFFFTIHGAVIARGMS